MQTIEQQFRVSFQQELNTIFSCHNASILFNLLDQANSFNIDPKVVLKKGFDYNFDGFIKAFRQLDEKVRTALVLEMREVDEGHTVSRMDRLRAALIAHLDKVVQLMIDEPDRLGELTELDEQIETIIVTQTVLAAQKKKVDRAEGEYRQLVNSLGEDHPITVEAGNYLLKQIHISMQQLDQAKADFNIIAANH